MKTSAQPQYNLREASRADVLRFVLFVAGYSLSTIASEHLYGSSAVPSPFWLPDAVLLCTLLFAPQRTWWVIVLAIWPIRLIVGAPSGTPAWFMLFGVANDSLKALLTASVLNGVLGRGVRLNSFRQFLIFVCVAAVAVPLLSAGAATPARYVLGDSLWGAGYRWFMGDALAQVVVTPALIYWCAGAYRRPNARLAELGVMSAGLVAVSYYAFVVDHHSQVALFYAPVPFLIWAALRLHPFGVANAIGLVSLVAVVGAADGGGVFSGGSSADVVLSIQLFLLWLALPSLALAILIAERESRSRELEVLLDALRESEERFRLVADTAPALIWISSIDKACTFFNKGWLDFTGRSLEEEYGNGWSSGVHVEDRARCLDTYSTAFDGRTPFEVEYRLRRFDGEYRWVVEYGVPRFEADGRFCGYIGSCVDVTERNLAKERLQELSGGLIDAQEQERARIARELHDDFCQRLAMLPVSLHVFQSHAGGLSPEERNHLLAIANDIKQMSSELHQLSHRLHPSTLDILGLVGTLTGLCQEFRRQHRMEISFVHRNVPEHLPPDVSACAFRIVQEALRNVETHSGVTRAAVELFGRDDALDLIVSDAGAGFDPRSARRASGLGLISMRERLRLVGGRLEIESAPSRGTTLRASLPMPRDAGALRPMDALSS